MLGNSRAAILAALLLRPDKTIHGRELARLTGISPGTLHRELQALNAMGVLTRRDIGRQVFYAADRGFPLFEELASIMRKTAVSWTYCAPHSCRCTTRSCLCVWINGFRRKLGGERYRCDVGGQGRLQRRRASTCTRARYDTKGNQSRGNECGRIQSQTPRKGWLHHERLDKPQALADRKRK